MTLDEFYNSFGPYYSGSYDFSGYIFPLEGQENIMKKFKIFGLICCIFLLSGCSAEYNLTINNSTMEEDINAIFDKATESELASRM